MHTRSSKVIIFGRSNKKTKHTVVCMYKKIEPENIPQLTEKENKVQEGSSIQIESGFSNWACPLLVLIVLTKGFPISCAVETKDGSDANVYVLS